MSVCEKYQKPTLLPPIHVHALIYETAGFQSGQVVSYISACTKLFGDKCTRVPTGGSTKKYGKYGNSKGQNMGEVGSFHHFSCFSCKNMGNMGILNRLSGFPRAFL